MGNAANCAHCGGPLRTGKRFCSAACRGNARRMPLVDMPCKVCGKISRLLQAHVRRGQGACCSRKCLGLWQRRRVTRRCATCGGDFSFKGHEAGRRPARYCSARCRGVATRRPPVQCPMCGEMFLRFRRGRGVYCSRGCANAAHAERMSGRGNANYRHGNGGAPYNIGFRAVRAAVRERDGVCALCDGTERLHAHHIDEHKFNDAFDNLISLCVFCHLSFHRLRDHSQAEQLSRMFKEIAAERSSTSQLRGITISSPTES